jgi:hypothetical protein
VHYAGRDFQDKKPMRPAICQFVEQIANGPPGVILTPEDRLMKKPTGEGVYYYSGPNGHSTS